MLTAKLLGFPAVAGEVSFEFASTANCPPSVSGLPDDLRMFECFSGLRIIALSSQGDGDVAMAVVVAVLGAVVNELPVSEVFSFAGGRSRKIEEIGDVSLEADSLSAAQLVTEQLGSAGSGGDRETTNLVVTGSGLRDSHYPKYKQWIETCEAALRAKQLPFRLTLIFWAVSFAGDPRPQAIAVLARLIGEYIKRSPRASHGV